MATNQRLIQVSLPLQAISEQSAREKSIHRVAVAMPSSKVVKRYG
jgi:adenine-specific DNA methylase